MTAETPEKSVFTAIRCKSADRHFMIILGVRANHGSISRLLKIHDEDEENEVGKLKATPHKARQNTSHVINLQIFRHIKNNFLTIRQYAFKNSMQSDEKYICVSAAQASCGIALTASKSHAKQPFAA